MCTVSFVPRNGENNKDRLQASYLLGMNRDERFTRAEAHAPKVVAGVGSGVNAVFPYEPGGGTWLALNSRGVALALLNWNIERPLGARSRGEIIPQLIHIAKETAVVEAVGRLDLAGVSPFRLVGILPAGRQVYEWRWNGEQLVRLDFPWSPQFWFSSGRSDAKAAEGRGVATTQALQAPDTGSRAWLRALHSSHIPHRGAFSLCVHRDDARTVSYSEIHVGNGVKELGYAAGSPCEARLDEMGFVSV